MLSALGLGKEASWQAFMRGDVTLHPETQWMPDTTRAVTVGHYHAPLSAFPEKTPEYLQSRNNQLLETALNSAFCDQVAAQKARFGSERIAVIIGTSTTGSDENAPIFREVVAGKSWPEVDFHYAKQLLASPASYLAWRFGITGPAYAISTACTSGAKALMSAARLIRAGLCDAVICGGMDNLSEFTLNGFDSLAVLSDTQTRPFSAVRSGINIGEGGAVFVLSREKISTIALKGYASGSDAYHMSTPRPDGSGAKQVMQEALNQAGMQARDIDWVNAHGTGTPANDAMEARAIGELLGDVPVTSTKAQTGHTLGSAGALEAAIAWLACNHEMNPTGRIPPQWFCAEPDSALPIHLATPEDAFRTTSRNVLSNSFAFGGNNTALLIGSADD